MRNLSFIFSMLLCFYSQAQITITSADMPAYVDTFYSKRDPLPLPPGFSIGQKGANIIWDFSNLDGTVPVSTYAVARTSTPYSADFPNATVALTNDRVGYVYYQTTQTAFKIQGFSTIDANLGTISVNYNPIPDQYRFPTAYPNNFSGSSGFVEAKPYADLPPNIQHLIDSVASGVTVLQVRATNTSTHKDTIDGWGKVITPLGTYDALRRKRIEFSTTVVAGQIQGLFGPIWVDFTTIKDTTIEHSWLTKITKLPVVTLGYDTSNNVISAAYSLIPPPPLAGFTWDNPSGGTVNFTNTSQNSPATFDWDFGDGGSSDVEDPSHDYTANGSYYVCLTVTNESGNNTFCDTVKVTGIVSNVTVSGKILSELNAKIRSVKVDATGTSPQSMVTDTSGSYSFTFSAGDSATITPSKTNDTTNGITTLDIIFIQKQILVSPPLPLNTPSKLIAADVNGSKSVTTLDIVFVRSVILRVNPTFPGGKVWSFIPSDYQFADSTSPFVFPNSRTFDNLSTDWTNQDFVGVKIGDVNNSWNPLNGKTDAVDDVRFELNDLNTMPGEEITIPVKVKDFKNVTGYQFTLSWNPEVLDFKEVTNASLNGYFGTTKTSNGFLTTSWNDDMAKDVSLDDDAIAFELKFKVTGGTGTSSEIKIGSEMTESEAYNENLDLLTVSSTNCMVKVGDASSLVNHPSSIINLKVQPNPFINSTEIMFELTQDQVVTLSIYDLLGKQIKEMIADYSAGKHVIEWAGETDSGKSLNGGLYHVRIAAGDYETGLKILLAR